MSWTVAQRRGQPSSDFVRRITGEVAADLFVCIFQPCPGHRGKPTRPFVTSPTEGCNVALKCLRRQTGGRVGSGADGVLIFSGEQVQCDVSRSSLLFGRDRAFGDAGHAGCLQRLWSEAHLEAAKPESTDWLLVGVGFLGRWRVGVVRGCWGCGLVCLGVLG